MGVRFPYPAPSGMRSKGYGNCNIPLQGTILSRGWELNPRPKLYESLALPLSYLGWRWYNFNKMYRSRLSRLEEKRNLRRMVWMVVVVAGILGAAMMWGIPFLVRVAMFAGAFGQSGRQVDKSDLIPPAPPTLAADFEATNSARLTIKGWTEPGAVVYLTQNREPAGNAVAREDGGFLFDEVKLLEGNNTFAGVAVDQGGNKSRPSTELKVRYSTQAPKLEIESPGDGQTVRGSQARVEVKGVTDAEARLTVNDRLVVVDTGGRFSTLAGLTPGDNTLVIVAVDRAGNQSRKELGIKYEP